METRKRSSLRKPATGNKKTSPNEKPSRRRISFNSRKSIREFRHEEKHILDYEVLDFNSETAVSPKSNQKVTNAESVTILHESIYNVENIPTTTNNDIAMIRDSLESNKSVFVLHHSVDVTLFSNEKQKIENNSLDSKSKINGNENDSFSFNNLNYESNEKMRGVVWESSDALLSSIPKDLKETQKIIGSTSMKETTTDSTNYLENANKPQQKHLLSTTVNMDRSILKDDKVEKGEVKSSQSKSINEIIPKKSQSFVPCMRDLFITSGKSNEAFKNTTQKRQSTETESAKKAKISNKDESCILKYTQDDNMSLESTTFLTQEKLGDETIHYSKKPAKTALMDNESILDDIFSFTETSNEKFLHKIESNEFDKDKIIFSVNNDSHVKENIKRFANINVPFLHMGEIAKRKTEIQHENIENVNDEQLGKVELGKKNSKDRRTILLHENIKLDSTAVSSKSLPSKDQVVLEKYSNNYGQSELEGKNKQYYKNRRTMMLNENIELDPSVLPSKSVFSKDKVVAEKHSEIIEKDKTYSKGRRTMVLNDSMELDVSAIASESIPFKNEVEVEKHLFHDKQPKRIEEGDKTYCKDTVILNENMELDITAVVSDSVPPKDEVQIEEPLIIDKQLKKIEKSYCKDRRTMVLNEKMELEASALPSKSMSSKGEIVAEKHSFYNKHSERVEKDKIYGNNRRTMVLNKNIELDASAIVSETVAFKNEVEIEKQSFHDKQPKRIEEGKAYCKDRRTIVLNENMELDASAIVSESVLSKDNAVIENKHPEGIEKGENYCKDRRTMMLNENVQSEASVLPLDNKRYKNTIMEEGCPITYEQAERTKSAKIKLKQRRTLILNESILLDASIVPSQSVPSNDSVMAQKRVVNSVEQKISDGDERYVKDRRTILLRENIEEDITNSLHNTHSITVRKNIKSEKTELSEACFKDNQTLKLNENVNDAKRIELQKSLRSETVNAEFMDGVNYANVEQLQSIEIDKNYLKDEHTMKINENIEKDVTESDTIAKAMNDIYFPKQTLYEEVDRDVCSERGNTAILCENIEDGTMPHPLEHLPGAIPKNKCEEEKTKYSLKRTEIEFKGKMVSNNKQIRTTLDMSIVSSGAPAIIEKDKKDNKDIHINDNALLLKNMEFQNKLMTEEHLITHEQSVKNQKNCRDRRTMVLNENMELETSAVSSKGILSKDGIEIKEHSNIDEQPKIIEEDKAYCKDKRTMVLTENYNTELGASAIILDSVFSKDEVAADKYSIIDKQLKGNEKDRRTIILNENIELDTPVAFSERMSSKDEVVEKYSFNDKQINLMEKSKRTFKDRRTIMLNENIELDSIEMSSKDEVMTAKPCTIYKQLEKIKESQRHVQDKSTIILNENTELTISTKDKPKLENYSIIDKQPEITQEYTAKLSESIRSNGKIMEEKSSAKTDKDKKYYKDRRTMMLNENMELEVSTLSSKSTLLQNEKVLEKHTMVLNNNKNMEIDDSELCSESKLSIIQERCPTNYEQPEGMERSKTFFKDRRKMLNANIEVETAVVHTLPKNDIITEESSISREQCKKIEKDETHSNGRRTIMLNENIDLDVSVLPSDSTHCKEIMDEGHSIRYAKYKRTEKSKDYDNGDQPTTSENIEKDVTKSIHFLKHKSTVILEPNEKDAKSRQTLILCENIEEDNIFISSQYSQGAIPKDKYRNSVKQRQESIYSVESMDTKTESTNEKVSSQQIKREFPDELYSTPSKTSVEQERLRRLYTMTPRQSLMEFTKLEKTILQECNTSTTKSIFRNNKNVNCTEKSTTSKGSFEVDISGLELNDSNLVKRIPNKQLYTLENQVKSEDIVKTRMSTLFNEAFDSDNMSLQDVRKQTIVPLNSIADINISSSAVENMNRDKSVTKMDASKYSVCQGQTNLSNIFDTSPLPEIEYDDMCSAEECISLVNTDKSINANDIKTDITNEGDYEQIDEEHICNNGSNQININNVTYTKVYRKCQQCQQTLTDSSSNNENTLASPIKLFPPKISINITPLESIYQKLDRIRNRPRLVDIDNLWHRMSADRSKNRTNFTQLQLEMDNIEKKKAIPKIWKDYKDEMTQYEMKIEEIYRNVTPLISVVDQLHDRLRAANLSQWIFDHNFEVSGIYLFTNRQSSTLKLRILFEELCPLGTKIRIKKIQYDHRIEQSKWKSIDFILDFQYKLQHQENTLLSLCKSDDAESICDMLQILQQSLMNILKLGIELQLIVTKHCGLLKRDGLHRYYLYKVVRRIISCPEKYDRVEKIEFEINLFNIYNVNYRNIVRPRLYNFQEEIELLPVGLEFLDAFLIDPVKFLKPDVVDSLFIEVM